MNRKTFHHSILVTVLAAAFACQTAAQTITQSITLQPGWNAIHLEVQPADYRASSVFANLPIASVWTRAERLSSVDFIQSPSEEAFNNPAWLRWFHPSRPEAFLGNLFAVFPNRAYLIKSTNTFPIAWNITGRPSLRRPAWAPDGFNLRGLPVDPATPPTFLNFFRSSRAHFNATTSQLEKIYRLNSASGQWQLVASTDPIQSGAAYWIYTRGASDFIAPLSASVDFGDGLDFGVDLSELNLRLANSTPTSISVTVRELPSPGSGRLAHYQLHPTLGSQWPDLPPSLQLPIAANSQTRLPLGIRRQDFSQPNYATVLEIANSAGARLFIPVEAQRAASVTANSLARKRKGLAASASIDPKAGLWVGSATLNAVSEPHSPNPIQTTPTKSPINFNLIIHVDASGQPRLLKDVTQMWRDGTYTNDSTGARVVDQPGEYVLLTDDTLIPFFQGAAIRDGEAVGRRLSSIGYDFPAAAHNNFMNLAGRLAPGQTLAVTLTLPHDHPRNPFKHKYHPDHDNMNARFDGPAIESFTTTRQIQLLPSATLIDGPAEPDYNYNLLTGTYRETITGIHKSPIHVSGTFRLSRVSLIAELNPGPTP